MSRKNCCIYKIVPKNSVSYTYLQNISEKKTDLSKPSEFWVNLKTIISMIQTISST